MSIRIILRLHSWVLVHDLCRVLFAGSTSLTHETLSPYPSMFVHMFRAVLSTRRRISFHPLTLHVTHLYIHNAFFESHVFMASTL